MTVEVRTAQLEDAHRLAAIGCKTFEEAYGAFNKRENLELYYSENFSDSAAEKDLRDPLKKFFLAEVDGITVGYAAQNAHPAPACVTGPRPVELHKLYVEKKAWGPSGVGAKLFETFLESVLKMGFQTAWLSVWEKADRARSFYFKNGFADVGFSTYRVGNDVQPDRIMQRIL
jgi:GNAT superfamily N-acetyltransferase